MNGRVRRTLSILLLSAVTGCASGPFHRKVASAPDPAPAPPELSQTPLYSPEMSDNSPHLPSLPGPTGAAVVPAPEPVAQKPRHAKKVRQTPATAKNATPGTPKSAGDISTGSTSPASSSTTSSASTDSAPAAGDKKQASSQIASSGAKPVTSPIGELTTGSSADAAETSHHTEDLIKSTRDGLDSVRRTLSDEEKKTAAEIRTFLVRAQQALRNGDVDGAYGLATKAKLLLDELTGS